MPEDRPFFAIRYTFPGFTFLFIVFFLIASNILSFLGSSALVIGPPSPSNPPNAELGIAALGVLFVLNGAPIGFVIAQPWFLFDRYFLWGREEFHNAIRNTFPANANPDRTRIVVRGDLWIFGLKNAELRGYIVRRVDVRNILGSTGFAILLGLMVGTLLRLIFNDALDLLTLAFYVASIPAFVFLMVSVLQIRSEQDRATMTLFEIIGFREPRGDDD